MRSALSLTFFIIAAAISPAALRYVDSTASGTGNGTSWANAWTTLAAVTGLSSGDTVYISGGASGASQTYSTTTNVSFPGLWANVVNGVTYQIGQDSAHNGTAVLDGQGGDYILFQNWANVTISGDAGDGARHFKLQNAGYGGKGDSWNGTRITYCDFSLISGPAAGRIMTFNPAQAVEIDHCYFYGANNTLDAIVYGNFTGSGYDSSMKFHDNLVYAPYKSSLNGDGADCLQFVGTGWSIYNNTFIGYSSATFSGGQHQDGLQSLTGTSFKAYGNVYVNMQNYAIYLEAFLGSGGFTNGQVYNNTSVNTTATGSQAFVVSGSATDVCTNVILANNLADTYLNPFTFRNPTTNPLPAAFVNCRIYNNVGVNSGSTNIFDSSISLAANNIYRTAVQAASDFASYTVGSVSNNYRLSTSASTLIAQGTDLSAYFTTDITGATRAAPWDIGPYKFFSGPGRPNTSGLLVGF